MFPPKSSETVERIARLEREASYLMDQRNRLKKNDVLRDSYTLAINSILEAIKRLANNLAVVKKKEEDE